MNELNFSAAISMRNFSRTFTYNNTSVLTLAINYPEVMLPRNRQAQTRINREILAQVNGFYAYATNDLFAQAIENYKEAAEKDYPFHAFDAVFNYEITYNLHCHLSLFSDQYAYTGGAHGNTVRTSDTWNLNTGERLTLESFFPEGKDYRAFLLEQILLMADKIMQEEPIYFEDYRDLIAQNFDEDSFYLTCDGLAIYYQQYEIAPYSTGIVVFTIPYEKLEWQPDCGNKEED